MNNSPSTTIADRTRPIGYAPARVQEQPVVIAISTDDPLALEMLRQFIGAGAGMSRRPRIFSNGFTQLSIGEYPGEIHYGRQNGGYQFAIPVRVVVVSRLETFSGADWLVFSTSHFPPGRFASAPRRLAMCRVPKMSGAVTSQARRLALFQDKRPGCRTHIAANAANHLAAEITRLGVFRPEFLSFPGGTESRHFELVSGWIRDERSLALTSACCLNADENRTGIVDRLAPEVVALLVRTAKAAFARIPNITEWVISTFGPDDFDWLGELGIQKVLLPYMWDKPKSQVQPDMVQNFRLVKELGALLDNALPFPVRVIQLRDNLAHVDVAWLIESSQERARQMLPALMEHPPAIFAQLKTPDEIFSRVQQEAFLYLLDTIRYGQMPNEDRPLYVNVGLEVHGGYWEYGNLFVGPKDEFLPLAWLDQSVRQHWGPWILNNKTRVRQMQRLDAMLGQLGY